MVGLIWSEQLRGGRTASKGGGGNGAVRSREKKTHARKREKWRPIEGSCRRGQAGQVEARSVAGVHAGSGVQAEAGSGCDQAWAGARVQALAIAMADKRAWLIFQFFELARFEK